ncbi:MAG: DNA polymerase III subunit delta [Chloroflexi bacterium]|nr:DNA polymerase III subunit delta [Chloroflexota bacterium]
MIHVFHGTDEFSMEEAVLELRAAVGSPEVREANTSVFEGAAINRGELIATARAVPFLADRRLIIVRGLLTRLESPKGVKGFSAQAWDGLGDELQNIPVTTDVAFIDVAERGRGLRRNGPGLRAAGPEARGREFRVPEKERLQAWIRERAAVQGAQVRPDAVGRLAWLVGGNLRMLEGEIGKLALYAGDRPVTVEDVDVMVSSAREGNVFAVVDAVLERRTGIATRALYGLLEDGTGVDSIIRLLTRQVRLVLLAKCLLESGVKDRGEIGSRIGLKQGFALDKTLRQAGRFGTGYLSDIHRRLLEADLASKTGRMDDRLSLEVLAARLSGVS